MVKSKKRKIGGTHPSTEPQEGQPYELMKARSEAAKHERRAKEEHNKRLSEKAMLARQNAMSASQIAEKLADEEVYETTMKKMMREAYGWKKIFDDRTRIMSTQSKQTNKMSSFDCDAVNILMDNIISMFEKLTGHKAFMKETGNVLKWSLKEGLTGGIIQELFNELQETLLDTHSVLSDYQRRITQIVKEHLHQLDSNLNRYFTKKMTMDGSMSRVGVKDIEGDSIYKVIAIIKSTKIKLDSYFYQEGWNDADTTNVKDKFYKICKSIVLELKPIYTTINEYYIVKGIQCNETVIFPHISVSRSVKSTFRKSPGKIEDRSNSTFGFGDIYPSDIPIHGKMPSSTRWRRNSAGGSKTRKSKRKVRKSKRKSRSKK